MALFAMVHLRKRSGIPTDAAINTFAFITPTGQNAADYVPAAQSQLELFYNGVTAPNTLSVASFLAPSVDRSTNAALIQWYDITQGSGPGLGAPIEENPFTLAPVGPGTGGDYPSEVAICMSYTAIADGVPEHAPGGTRPKARYRGRIYIGPVSNLVAAIVGATSENVVSDPCIAVLNAAAAKLAADGDANTANWGVWSRSDVVIRSVQGGWCDNAYDTIRSRGIEPTQRISWGVVNGRILNQPVPENPIAL